MGFLSDIKEKREQISGKANPAKWFMDLFSPNSSSGQKVTEEKAMTHTAVYSCVRIIAETIASLPLNVYRDQGNGEKKKAKDNYLYPLLHNKPNDLMTSFTWREVVLTHLLLWGNHYSQLEIDNAGKVVGIWPLIPSRMQVKERNRRLYYVYYPKNGDRVVYDQSEILHIPGLGFDGRVGKSVIKLAKEAIGLGMSAEEFGAKFFSQGAQPGGIVEYPESLSDDAYRRYKQDVRDEYQGLGNAHKMMVLEEGMKYHQTGIPPEDAQFLETRQFQKREIAMIYRVPPHMLGDMESGASYSSIEQQSISFVVNTIRPWLVRIEQALNDKLISSRNKQNYIKFVVEGLLRGDAESRGNFYNQMFNIGAMSINDIREKEDMNPVEGGDQNFVPLNMVPLNETNPRLEEEDSRTRTVEQRKKILAQRSAASRRNIRQRYENLLVDRTENLVETEVNKIQDLVNKELKSRNEQNFSDQLVEFYEGFSEEIKQELRPVIKSLADAVAEEAASEVDLDNYSIDDFFEDYLEVNAEEYAGYSRGQMLALMNEAAENDEDPVGLIEERLEEWEEKKAEKSGKRQAVKAENAISKEIYSVGGVAELRWVANPGACPICQEMDGTVVGIRDSFIGPGQTINAEGGFSPSSSIGHPPLHQEGPCECSISPY